MTKEELKQYIDENVYENDEGDITGEVLNEVLKKIFDESGMFVLEINSESGSMTSDELEMATSDHCVILHGGLYYYRAEADKYVAISNTQNIQTTNIYYMSLSGDTGFYYFSIEEYEKPIVIANPENEPTETLNKLRIGNTVYTAPQGPQGEQGPAGPQGETGSTGPQGEQGIQGETGATGATGPANTLSIGTVTGGDTASAEITGTAPNQTLNLTLPRGQQGVPGQDGADAVNPFKGWYTSSSNLPANPVVGDYAYVKGATASDPVAIYECTTAGSWSDSGRTFNPANNQEFASGENLNETYIDDTNLANPIANSLASANDCKNLAYKIGIITPINVPIVGTEINGYVNSSGELVAGTYGQKTLLMPFDHGGKQVQFTKSSSATGNMAICYLKDGNASIGTALNYCDNFSGRQIYSGTIIITIPSDCKYILALKAAGEIDNARLPETITVYNRYSNEETMVERLDSIEPIVGNLNDVIYNTETIEISGTEYNGFITSDGIMQIYTSGSSQYTVFMPFGQYKGKRITFQKRQDSTGNIVVSYLRDSYAVDDQPVHFCSTKPSRESYSETTTVEIPLDCEYIALLKSGGAGDMKRLPNILYVENVIEDLKDAKVEKMPYAFETRFQVNVETVQPQLTDWNDVSVDAKKTSAIYADNCVLYLPTTYTQYGEPTKLIIFCKQGGTKIGATAADDWNRSTANSSPILQSKGNGLPVFPYLISLGYAVLAADGEPDAWLTALNLGNGNTSADLRVCGNYVAVQSTRRAYDYVVKNFNIDANGAFIFGYSQGGQYAQNVVDLSGIPILAAAEVCPVCSFKYHQWPIKISPTTIGNVPNVTYAARLNIARMFGFGGNITTNQQLADLWYDPNEHYVVGYDPWTREAEDIMRDFQIVNDVYQFNDGVTIEDVTMKKVIKSPLKVWCAENDTTLGVDVMKTFVKAAKNAGCCADIVIHESGGHRYFDNQTTIGSVEVNGTTYTYTALATDIAIWFRCFGGY